MHVVYTAHIDVQRKLQNEPMWSGHRGGSRNSDRGGGLAPCKVRCPPRGIRGMLPQKILHCNLVQSGSKINTMWICAVAWIVHAHV